MNNMQKENEHLPLDQGTSPFSTVRFVSAGHSKYSRRDKHTSDADRTIKLFILTVRRLTPLSSTNTLLTF